MKSNFEELVELRELIDNTFDDCATIARILQSVLLSGRITPDDISVEDIRFTVDFIIKYKERYE